MTPLRHPLAPVAATSLPCNGHRIIRWRDVNRRGTLGLAAVALFFALTAGTFAGVVEMGPLDEWCAAANSLAPGDELALGPGEYRAPCVIRSGGAPGAPIVIRGADPQSPPRLVHAAPSGNVLEIRASHVSLRGLAFGPAAADVDGVRVISGDGVTIEGCRFSHLGGIAIAANHTSLKGLTVRRNVIVDSGSTGMYFGCHDGFACVLSGLRVESNYIHRVSASPNEVGYGLEVKLNSSGIVRDNMILTTKGPGIMVYGSRDLQTSTVVERNVVIGAEHASGIVVGGGPAVVQNNVAISNNEAGIGLEDYGRRGLLRRIIVAHNTLYGNSLGGITLPNTDVRDVVLVNNAVRTQPPAPALPARRSGVLMSGNVDCTHLPCFVDPGALDFSPFPGSLLLGSGVLMDGVLPKEDFSQASRGLVPTVGAIERPTGPLPLRLRP